EIFGAVEVPIALEALESLRFPERIPPDQRLALVPPKEGDRLYRHVGALDAVDGTLLGFEAGGVRCDSVLGQRTIPWEEVAALFVETLEHPAKVEDARVPISVDLAGAGGGRIQGRLVALERGTCRMVLGGATEITLPFQSIAELV